MRFYAGSPLRTQDGYNLGTLRVIDKRPRELIAQQIQVLDDLVALVVDEVELRLAARKRARRTTELNDDVVQALERGRDVEACCVVRLEAQAHRTTRIRCSRG